LLDVVFGNNSKLDYLPWKDAMCDDKKNKGARWLFSSATLRTKIFEKAGLKYEMKTK